MVRARKARDGVLGLMAALWAAAAIACSAPPQQKTPLLVCEAGEDGCPSEKPKTSKQPSKKTSNDDDEGPSGAPAPAASPPDEETPAKTDPDAGAEPEPEPGPICTALKGCCDQLKAAGYSDEICLEIVDTNSESACSLQHKQYKDYGDCT